jgi:antitoxin component of MazEF toxin-antitoxin module
VVKKTPLKEKVFVSKISKTTSTSANSFRTIIPYDLLSKLKMTHGDQLCWKLDNNKAIRIWKRTKKDKIPAEKIIDIKEAPSAATTPVKTDMKKVSMSTTGAEQQPQITATSHI